MKKPLTHDEKRAEEDAKQQADAEKRAWRWKIDDTLGLSVDSFKIIVTNGSIRSHFDTWEQVFKELFGLFVKKNLNNRRRTVEHLESAYLLAVEEVSRTAHRLETVIKADDFQRIAWSVRKKVLSDAGKKGNALQRKA